MPKQMLRCECVGASANISCVGMSAVAQMLWCLCCRVVNVLSMWLCECCSMNAAAWILLSVWMLWYEDCVVVAAWMHWHEFSCMNVAVWLSCCCMNATSLNAGSVCVCEDVGMWMQMLWRENCLLNALEWMLVWILLSQCFTSIHLWIQA